MARSCPACTFLNCDSAQRCKLCNTPLTVADSTSWNCSICTLLNPVTSVRCMVCATPKTVINQTQNEATEKVVPQITSRRDALPGSSTSKVSRDPSSNASLEIRDDATGASTVSVAPALLTTTSHSADSWTCPACTLVNQSTSERCEVCTNPKPIQNPTEIASRDTIAKTITAISPKKLPSSDLKSDPVHIQINQQASPHIPSSHESNSSEEASNVSQKANDFASGIHIKNGGPSIRNTAFLTDVSKSWTCSTCTLLNHSISVSCKACTSPKPSLSENGVASQISSSSTTVSLPNSPRAEIKISPNSYTKEVRRDIDKQCPLPKFAPSVVTKPVSRTDINDRRFSIANSNNKAQSCIRGRKRKRRVLPSFLTELISGKVEKKSASRQKKKSNTPKKKAEKMNIELDDEKVPLENNFVTQSDSEEKSSQSSLSHENHIPKSVWGSNSLPKAHSEGRSMPKAVEATSVTLAATPAQLKVQDVPVGEAQHLKPPPVLDSVILNHSPRKAVNAEAAGPKKSLYEIVISDFSDEDSEPLPRKKKKKLNYDD